MSGKLNQVVRKARFALDPRVVGRVNAIAAKKGVSKASVIARANSIRRATTKRVQIEALRKQIKELDVRIRSIEGNTNKMRIRGDLLTKSIRLHKQLENLTHSSKKTRA